MVGFLPAIMYQFVKDSTGGSKRLFLRGSSPGDRNGASTNVRMGPPIVTDLSRVPANTQSLQAIRTKKRLSTEVLGSSIESTKTSRKNEDGTRRITTQIVRKVTTLTRGEEKSVTEDLTSRASVRNARQSADVAKALEDKPVKKVKVRM